MTKRLAYALSFYKFNPNTIKLLEDNIDNIYWYELSRNPSIFELDYETMKRNNEGIYEELIKEVMKPSRVFKKS